VEHERDEARHQPQAEAVEQPADAGGVQREVAHRPELGRREAERRHLAEHSLWLELATPAGHLAHAPGDRCAREPAASTRSVAVAMNLTRHFWLERSID
jgi:hypothetical protein